LYLLLLNGITPFCDQTLTPPVKTTSLIAASLFRCDTTPSPSMMFPQRRYNAQQSLASPVIALHSAFHCFSGI